VRLSNVQVSLLTTDTRTVYVNPDWVGSQITFGAACPADGASVTGSTATAAITQAFSTSGIKICDEKTFYDIIRPSPWQPSCGPTGT
jgi:hypothetical protein